MTRIKACREHFTVRTSFIDTKMQSALKNGIRQIVMLAAGMDSRAFRLNFPPGVRLFELDRQEVFAYKNESLKDAKPKCERRTLAVDPAR